MKKMFINYNLINSIEYVLTLQKYGNEGKTPTFISVDAICARTAWH